MNEKEILIDNLTINYKIIGNGNIPIILLHGWGLSSDKYSVTAEYLSQMANGKWQIIIPDLPGFGASDAPREAWGVGEYAEFVKKFIDELFGNLVSKSSLETRFPSEVREFILIGHSFGGRIAIKFAAKYPQILKVLVLTGAAGVKHPLTFKQKIFYSLAKTGKIIFFLPLVNRLEKSAQRLLYRAAREKDYYETQGIMREIFKKVIDEDLMPCLEKISASGGPAVGRKIPTLLVWGKNDHSTPLADAHIMKEKIADSRLKIVDEANHSLPYQYPEKFAKIIAGFIEAITKKIG